jgi:hypothetical protein
MQSGATLSLRDFGPSTVLVAILVDNDLYPAALPHRRAAAVTESRHKLINLLHDVQGVFVVIAIGDDLGGQPAQSIEQNAKERLRDHERFPT